MVHTVYIAFGSNLGDKLKVIQLALERVSELPSTKLISRSSIYTSESWGYDSTNEFYNGVIRIETGLGAFSLLEHLQVIEVELGRTQKTSSDYADRVIDLDLLSYDHLVLTTSTLTLPHPYLHVRNFVLEPLAEISPSWTHPLYLDTAEMLLKKSPDTSKVQPLDAL